MSHTPIPRTALGFVWQFDPAISPYETELLVNRDLMPVLTLAKQNLDFKCSFYFSGHLTEHLDQKKFAPFFNLIRDLMKTDQVEILGGFFYEPLVSNISAADAEIHIKASLDWWDRKGVQLKSFFINETGFSEELAEIVARTGFTNIICAPSDLALSTQSKNSDGSSTVFSHETLPLRIFLNQPGAVSFGDSTANPVSVACSIADYFTHPIFKITSTNRESFTKTLLTQIKTVIDNQPNCFILPRDLPESNIDNYPQTGFCSTTKKPSTVNYSGETKHFNARCNILRTQIEQLENSQGKEGISPCNMHELQNAKRLLAKCTWRRFCDYESALTNDFVQRYAYEVINFAQVAFDAAAYPDVDPSEGWVYLQEPDVQSVDSFDKIIWTQLSHFFLNSETGGTFRELDYKPRKVNFILNPEFCKAPTFSESIEKVATWSSDVINKFDWAKPTSPPEMRIIKKNPGLLALRYTYQPSSQSLVGAIKLNKELSVKSGIGAHLNHATTGFSVEYWLEGDKSSLSDSYIISNWAFTFTSLSDSALRLQALMCVGGIHSEARSMDSTHLILGTDIPGGLYGIRLIDSVDDFLIDFRFSKEIGACTAVPVYSPAEGLNNKGSFHGIRFSFYIPAWRTLGDDKSTMLFFSIM